MIRKTVMVGFTSIYTHLKSDTLPTHTNHKGWLFNRPVTVSRCSTKIRVIGCLGLPRKCKSSHFHGPNFSEFGFNRFEGLFWFPPALRVVELKLLTVNFGSTFTTIGWGVDHKQRLERIRISLSAAMAAVVLTKGAHPYSLSNRAIGLCWRYWHTCANCERAFTDWVVPTGNTFMS